MLAAIVLAVIVVAVFVIAWLSSRSDAAQSHVDEIIEREHRRRGLP